jgi:hypothetical protein
LLIGYVNTSPKYSDSAPKNLAFSTTVTCALSPKSSLYKFSNIFSRLIKPNGVSVNCNVAELARFLVIYQLSGHIADAFAPYDVD